MLWSNLRALLGRSLLVLFFVSLAGLAAAMDDALLGRWAYKAGSCEEDMTFKIAKDGLSGAEFYCAPQRIRREKGGWKIQFSCSGEGNEYVLRVHWRLLKNGRLRETSGGKTKDYTRCSAGSDTPLDPANPYSSPSKCVACFNEAQQLTKSVGGYCPAACAPVFETMVCDSKGICRLPD